MTENSELTDTQPIGGDLPAVQVEPPVEPAVVEAIPETAASSEPELPTGGPEQPAQEPARRATTRATGGQRLGRVTLGSALIAMDTVNERLDRLDEAEIEQHAHSRTLDDVLVPMAQWPERFGVTVDRPTRHLMLGMMIDARSRVGATVRFFNGLGNLVASAINGLLQPVSTQRVFRPLRQGITTAVERGEGQVAHWRALGRAEDARSRALAETALSNAAEETMDELVTNERIEVFIQDIIQSQTTGIVDEIIEEIRERAVSSDKFFERPVRRLFRRPRRSQIPGPDFDPRLVRPIVHRDLPIPQGSLLGYYAGFFSRLLALIIDVLLIVLLLALGSSLLTTAIDVLGLTDSIQATFGTSGTFTLVLAGNGLAVVVGYLILFWMLTGQTLGMMLLGVRVVNRQGGRVKFWQSVLRIIGYFLLPGIFFFGFLWILGDDRREAWHDKLAGTIVVYAWDARPDETFLTYSMVMDE